MPSTPSRLGALACAGVLLCGAGLDEAIRSQEVPGVGVATVIEDAPGPSHGMGGTTSPSAGDPLELYDFDPAPGDAGGLAVKRVYDSVVHQWGDLMLGMSAGASRVGNMQNMGAEACAQGDSAVCVAASLLGGVGSVPYVVKNWLSPAKLPTADPDIAVAPFTKGHDEGPYMICTQWQESISATTRNNPAAAEALRRDRYLMHESDGETRGGTKHSWVSYIDCKTGRIVVADPWLYGPRLKISPPIGAKVAAALERHAPGFDLAKCVATP